jgi:hypothetical protein
VDPELHRIAPVPDGFLGVSYERFWQMPVAVVLTVLWLAGMALLSSCVLMLYILGTLLASVLAGA